MKTLRNVFFVFLITSFCFSCKRSQPIMPVPDKGCEGRSEVSADFHILEMHSAGYNTPNSPLFTDTDTIFADKNVRLVPKGSDFDEVRWYIEDKIYKSKTIDLYFEPERAGETITYTLAVNKAHTDILCFPNDDGYDSITRTLYIAPAHPKYPFNDGWDGWHPLVGTYRFYVPQLNDSIDMVYTHLMQSYGVWTYIINIHNFDGKGGVFSSGLKNGYMEHVAYREVRVGLYKTSINGKTIEGEHIFRLQNGIDGEAFVSLEKKVKYDQLSPVFHYKGRKL